MCCHDPCRHGESLRYPPGRDGNELWVSFNVCRRLWGMLLRGEDSVTPAPHLPSPFLIAPISRLLLLQPVLPPVLLNTAWGSPRLDCPWQGKIWHCGSQGWKLSPVGPLPDPVHVCPNPLPAFPSVSEVRRSSCPHSHVLKKAVEELSHCTDTGLGSWKHFWWGFLWGWGSADDQQQQFCLESVAGRLQ